MTPAMEKAKKWIIAAVSASVGGGIAGAVTAAMDPTKYHFPHDFGSGKLWKYFLMGAGLTFGGMLLHSPLGQKLIGSYKTTQEQLAADQAKLQQSKVNIQEVQQDLKQAQATSQPPSSTAKS
jgi:hypothetical protein